MPTEKLGITAYMAFFDIWARAAVHTIVMVMTWARVQPYMGILVCYPSTSVSTSSSTRLG
jgi:hypothetical protein